MDDDTKLNAEEVELILRPTVTKLVQLHGRKEALRLIRATFDQLGINMQIHDIQDVPKS